ncbi:hypothetical protein FNF28_01472 [Cafeteria roenbergensis]|nr:hypothetical protein FNF28_01472 [Cafeteria roenbergensis]
MRFRAHSYAGSAAGAGSRRNLVDEPQRVSLQAKKPALKARAISPPPQPVRYVMGQGLEGVDPRDALARHDVVAVDVTEALRAARGVHGRRRGSARGASMSGGASPALSRTNSDGSANNQTVVVMHTGVLRSRHQRRLLVQSLERFKRVRWSLFFNFLGQAAFMMTFLYWDFLRSKIDYELPTSWFAGHVLAIYVIAALRVPVPDHMESSSRKKKRRGGRASSRSRRDADTAEEAYIEPGSHAARCRAVRTVFCWPCMRNPRLVMVLSAFYAGKGGPRV